MNKAVRLERPNYAVEVKYSPEAIEKKLMKFITPLGESFEISAEEMISMLVGQVNTETLAPAFVDSQKIDVVEVGRQLECVLDKDMKKGEKIRINYFHPFPIEFALIEEVYKTAKINKDVKVFELTDQYIEVVKEKIKPEMREYLNKFYKSFSHLSNEKNKTDTK